MFCRRQDYPKSIFGSGEGVLISGNKCFWQRNMIHANLICIDGLYYRMNFVEYCKFVLWYKKNLSSFVLMSDDDYYRVLEENVILVTK